MPGKVEDSDGRLPASYANFYIGNDAVLVPVFWDKNDAAALSTLSGVFPQQKNRRDKLQRTCIWFRGDPLRDPTATDA